MGLRLRDGTALVAAAAVVALSGQPAQAAGQSQAVDVTVRAGDTIAVVGAGAVGVNTPLWNPRLLDPQVPDLVRRAGIGMLEFNGGGVSDLYHWRDGSLSPDPDAADHPYDYGSLRPQFSFDQFERLARQVGAGTLVHVNYGTGTPAEAAGWVRYANKVRHLGVRDWVVGEEVWGNGGIEGVNFEPDAHADRSPAAYGRNALRYIAAMKAVDPTVRVGVEVTGFPFPAFQDWDETVLSIVGRAVDFVDFHYYPLWLPDPSDEALLRVPRQAQANVGALRQLVDRYAGHAHRVDLVAGETNSAVTQAPQQVSIVNALYLADNVVSLLESGTRTVAWWALHNGGFADSGGDLGLLSTGECNDAGTVCAPPADTPFPPYHAMRLVGALARPGGRLVAVSTGDPLVVGHAVREPDGSLMVLLLNDDPVGERRVRLDLRGYVAAAGDTVLRYGPGSDRVEITRGTGPAGRDRVLPPYSLTGIVLRPGITRR
jgi:alpha-N-arabinofuranosidase